MTFLTFTLTGRSVFTGEYDANDEPISRRPVSTVRINLRNIVSVETRTFDDHVDLIIGTTDGETWTLPGTPEHLAQVDRLMGIDEAMECVGF